jgi:hypothetical protein
MYNDAQLHFPIDILSLHNHADHSAYSGIELVAVHQKM